MPKVLIVEDDPDDMKAILTTLQGAGYETKQASNETDALEKVSQSPSDLILLDVMMEHLDGGFRVCQNLKEDQRTRNIPIIILTAVSKQMGIPFSPKTDEEYLPADAYLEKPIDPEKLLSTVEDILASK